MEDDLLPDDHRDSQTHPEALLRLCHPLHISETDRLRLRLVASLEEGELPRRLWRITDVAAQRQHFIQWRGPRCSR